MYFTVIKHDRHLRTGVKCIKHEPKVSGFYISQVFSNVRVHYILSESNTGLHSLTYAGGVTKTIKHAFSMFYTLIKRFFLPIRACRGSHPYYKT